MPRYEIVIQNLEKPYNKTTLTTPLLANRQMALTWLRYNTPFRYYSVISIRELKI